MWIVAVVELREVRDAKVLSFKETRGEEDEEDEEEEDELAIVATTADMDAVQRERDAAVARGIIGDFESEFRAGLGGGEGYNRQEEDEEREKREDMRLLQEAWIREKTAPAIFPYEEALVERVLARVRRQLAFIELNSAELQTQERDIKLVLVVVESELERVQFMLRAYVRHRLRKLDAHAAYVEQHPTTVGGRLSADERTYVAAHRAMLNALMADQYLRRTGGGDGEDNAEQDGAGPDLSRPVVVRSAESTVVAPWRVVAKRVAKREVELV